MKWLRMLLAKLNSKPTPAARSLLHALKSLVPPAVLRDVIAHSRDRRHLGSLAAAWIGITENELMYAVSQQLQLPFQFNIDTEDGIQLMLSNSDLLPQLERAGAVFCSSEFAPLVIACVDPTEVRSISAVAAAEYPVVISSWTAIRSALDHVLAAAAQAETDRSSEVARSEEALALETIHLVFSEIAPYDIRSVDLFLSSERPRYQFLLQNGKRGVGLLHAKVAPILERFFRRAEEPERSFAVMGAIGTLKATTISEGAVYRLLWSPITRQLETPPLVALPAPQVHSREISEDDEAAVVAEVPLDSSSFETRQSLSHRELSRPRVLIADDNLMFARILEKYLDKHGYSTVLVKDGKEALDVLRSEELPALVVTDLHMPIMNGRELVAAIRSDERFSELRIIVLTSDEDAEAEIQVLGIGADAFVAKSKDPRVLCSHVTRLTAAGPRREAA